MLNLHRRLATGGALTVDDDGPHICYAIMVGMVSLLVFCVLLAVFSPARACAITSLIDFLFGLVALLRAHRNGSGLGARQPAPTVRLVHRCTGGLADAAISTLPTFAYNNKGGGDEPRGSCQLLCTVCLEEVQGGEMARQLSPCRHLFHVDCIDMWLHTHRTCPLFRCELPPRNVTATATGSSVDVLALPPE
jgi:hypothetical protein